MNMATKETTIDPSLIENYHRLAMNLLNFRKGTNLDQIAFAKKCGISRHQYLRAEGAHRSITLQTILKICQTFNIEVGDLFKDPFNRALRVERRESVKVQNRDSKVVEEKYLSLFNKNISVKKLRFGAKQIRIMKLENKTKTEILVLSGELMVIFSSESSTLKPGQHLSLDFNPQLSFDQKPTEKFKMGSLRGAEVLLIQSLVH